MNIQALRGTTDLLGEPLNRWAALEHTVKRLCRVYGYQEIRTPIIEDAALFLRTIGEQTDIVQKEMFQFKDRGDHAIVLRPEGTAAVVRAYLEHNLDKTEGFSKLYYLGPMFRAERPQAGRFRQFHQFGVEAIGSYSPWVDVEAISLCVRILQACGVKEMMVWLASMGCRPDQQRSAEALRKRLEPNRNKLCQDCQKRFDKNIFRVLDCKNPTCHELAWAFKGSPFLLCEDCTKHFDTVRLGLKESKIAFEDTHTFARGLDYYTQTVFEVRSQGLGAQDAVAAGGRYNHLVEDLGGAAMGAVGFAAGIERALMARQAQGKEETPASRRGVYLAVAQAQLTSQGFQMVNQLRSEGVFAITDYDGRSLKAQLREADKAHCRFVAIFGEAELKARTMTLKDLEAKTQESIPLDQFTQVVSQRLKGACHL